MFNQNWASEGIKKPTLSINFKKEIFLEILKKFNYSTCGKHHHLYEYHRQKKTQVAHFTEGINLFLPKLYNLKLWAPVDVPTSVLRNLLPDQDCCLSLGNRQLSSNTMGDTESDTVASWYFVPPGTEGQPVTLMVDLFLCCGWVSKAAPYFGHS